MPTATSPASPWYSWVSNFHAFVLLLLMVCTVVSTADAQWSSNPNINTAISTATADQTSPAIISDGAGGAIIAWEDDRADSVTAHIYAQRINSSGAIQWTTNGVAVCTAAGGQYSPALVTDGAGGAIIVWEDNRGTSTDIYARRITSAGTLQWTANGTVLCTAAGDQTSPCIVSDGAGGAIVAWEDGRSSLQTDIYAQRINGSGVPQWTSNGVVLCSAVFDQTSPVIVSDGSSGAIVAWEDYRADSVTADVYARHINASGTPLWATNGTAICTAVNDQISPQIIGDGSGGAIIAWEDYRTDTAVAHIYARRVGSTGTVQWSVNGNAVCTVAGGQYSPVIAADGSGGAIIAWEDYRTENVSAADIYAQRLGSTGAAQWSAGGIAVSASENDQTSPVIVGDGSGTAIVAWEDYRANSVEADVFAQRINAAGVPTWTSGGAPIGSALRDQIGPVIAAGSSGGAIITWEDYRSDGASADVYAQSVDSSHTIPRGPESKISTILDIPKDQGGKVRVTWQGSPNDITEGSSITITSYGLWRKISGSAVAPKTGKSPYGILNDTLGVSYDFITSVPAIQSPQYNVVAPTLYDSSSSGAHRATFLVTAHTANPQLYFISRLDSGYSADNIPPITPQSPLLTPTTNGPIRVSWAQDLIDPDLDHYTVYKSTSSGFTPSPSTLLRTTRDTVIIDSAASVGTLYYYRIIAVDLHDNASPATAQLSTTALPLQITLVTANLSTAGRVQLEWHTESETNIYGFQVQRRQSAAAQFSDVAGGFIPGHGTTIEPQTYTFTDSTAADGRWYYRLEQIDLDGSMSYSDEIAINVVLGIDQVRDVPRSYGIDGNYPNPFNPSTTIRYALPATSAVRLVVYDVLGRTIATLFDGVQESGWRSVVWEGNGEGSGIYFCRMDAASVAEPEKRFSKTTKMLLIR